MPITLNGNGSISGLDSVVSNSTVTALGFIPSGSTAVSDGIFLPGANSLGLATASTQRVHIDSSGRVGIGKTPDATAFPVVGGLQLAGGANLFSWGNFGGTYLTANAFYNGSNWIYQANNASSVYIAADGNHVWLRASSGTAGNTATLLESARIDTSGRLLVGTSTARDFFGGTDTPALQVEGIGNAGRELSVTSSTASGSGGVVLLAKQRSGAVGGQTIVQSGDQLGYLGFQGSDGAKMLAGAAIEATVDGTPGVNDLPTRLVFSTTADGASSPTERMRITSTGQMRLAGAGITFNGDTATANELDDYEEGTWTPVLSFGGGSVGISYTTAPVGYYTRIGRLVYAQLGFRLSNKGSSTGDVAVSGLPFTISGVGSFLHATAAVNAHFLTASGVIVHALAAGGTSINYRKVNDSNADTSLRDSDFTNTVGFYHSLVYFT